MTTRDGFPRSLLNQPSKARVAYFIDYTMAHPILQQAAMKLMHSIEEPAGASLIFIFGPTGVGKSTLLRRVSQKIISAALPKMNIDPGYIPIAGIEAIAPEFSQFDWKDFYTRALMALQEPMINNKINRSSTKLKLRFALEEALRHRQSHAFYVDEAQNLGKVASGRKLRDQADCVKSLANIGNTRFLLSGTYELLMLRNLSAQLTRRSMDIHFPRYRAELDLDVRAFKSVVQTFQRYLPLAETPNLLECWDFCYERSIGCVGILKDWLSRTLSAVLDSDENALTLTRFDLERHAWSSEQCMIMLAEAREEEKKLADKAGLQQELRAALGLELAATTTTDCPIATANAASSKPTGNHKTRSVGKPLPKRRPVGEGHHVNL